MLKLPLYRIFVRYRRALHVNNLMLL